MKVRNHCYIISKVAKAGAKLAKEGFDTLQENLEKSNEYAERYQHLSEEELREKMRRSHNTAEKMGIARVLKENGWIERKG